MHIVGTRFEWKLYLATGIVYVGIRFELVPDILSSERYFVTDAGKVWQWGCLHFGWFSYQRAANDSRMSIRRSSSTAHCTLSVRPALEEHGLPVSLAVTARRRGNTTADTNMSAAEQVRPQDGAVWHDLTQAMYTVRTKCAISYAASEIALLHCCVLAADSRLRKNAMTRQCLFTLAWQRTEFDGCLRDFSARHFENSDIWFLSLTPQQYFSINWDLER